MNSLHFILCVQHIKAAMYIGTAILIIGFAALIAAVCLLLSGLVYFQLMNSNIPPGVASPAKLHVVHCMFVGIAVVVSVHAFSVEFAGGQCKVSCENIFFEKFNTQPLVSCDNENTGCAL